MTHTLVRTSLVWPWFQIRWTGLTKAEAAEKEKALRAWNRHIRVEIVEEKDSVNPQVTLQR